MSSVIRVENLSKLYRLGEVGTGSLAHDVNRWWHRLRGQEDPYTQIGQINDRTTKAESDWVYALKDINFEVQQGDILGIIGRNGAGKSTLLKILSRVTAPTMGNVKVKGRIAALLEVGTGFHPELTGRDNIFLNGAILGMSKSEIRSKLDQIVDFSGCEAYLDTPVKRYSSGMQVRLAFAVAAHLEPEILIVDEVLAVGDAEFQRKCIGRMSEVAAEGRTVLFVSHNLAAVRRLCTAGLTMKVGTTSGIRPLDHALSEYNLEAGKSAWELDVSTQGRPSNSELGVRIQRISSKMQVPTYGEPWEIKMTVNCRKELTDVVVSYGFNSMDGSRVMTLDSDLSCPGLSLREGSNEVGIKLLFNPLHPGTYTVGCSIWKGNLVLDNLPTVAMWEVHSGVRDIFSHRGFGANRPMVEVSVR